MPTTAETTEKFIQAIQHAESSRDIESLAALFSSDAEISSIGQCEPLCGPEGVREFWTNYLTVFRQVQTRFDHVHIAGDLATLEWTSTGILSEGLPIKYQGATILEFIGTEICRFRTYYDSAVFVPGGPKLLGRIFVD